MVSSAILRFDFGDWQLNRRPYSYETIPELTASGHPAAVIRAHVRFASKSLIRLKIISLQIPAQLVAKPWPTDLWWRWKTRAYKPAISKDQETILRKPRSFRDWNWSRDRT